MSLIKATKAQLGLSVTPANNFVWDASADNGTAKLARGNAGATTQDIMTVDAAGKVAFPQLNSLFVGGSGYAKLPNGLIVQWGFATTAADGVFLGAFPVPWPNECMQVVATVAASNIVIAIPTFDNINYQIFANNADGGTTVAAGFRWIAIGH